MGQIILKGVLKCEDTWVDLLEGLVCRFMERNDTLPQQVE